MSTTMTLRLDDETNERLSSLAGATDRSKAYLTTEALKLFLENNEWQVQEIKQAVDAADNASPDQFVDNETSWPGWKPGRRITRPRHLYKMKVTWFKSAILDLKSVRDYITQNNPQAAQQVVHRIKDKVSLLSEQPGIGRLGRVPNTRGLLVDRTQFILPGKINGSASFYSA